MRSERARWNVSFTLTKIMMDTIFPAWDMHVRMPDTTFISVAGETFVVICRAFVFHAVIAPVCVHCGPNQWPFVWCSDDIQSALDLGLILQTAFINFKRLGVHEEIWCPDPVDALRRLLAQKLALCRSVSVMPFTIISRVRWWLRIPINPIWETLRLWHINFAI